MIRRILREYIPASWFHPVGIRKVIRRLEPRLPDVQGSLFLTFTFARETCDGDPAKAFELGRAKLRRLFYELRKGVDWNGKTYRMDEPYGVKVEFHQDGWAHFHVIFLSRRFLPGELLNKLWGLGRCNVQRIGNKDFRYLLKYVCKGCELPEWVKSRGRLRVFQSSHGFLKKTCKGTPERVAAEPDSSRETVERARDIGNIGERVARWEKMGLVVSEDVDTGRKHYNCVTLRCGFREMLGRLLLKLALENRYLGESRVLIAETKDLLAWTI